MSTFINSVDHYHRTRQFVEFYSAKTMVVVHWGAKPLPICRYTFTPTNIPVMAWMCSNKASAPDFQISLIREIKGKKILLAQLQAELRRPYLQICLNQIFLTKWREKKKIDKHEREQCLTHWYLHCFMLEALFDILKWNWKIRYLTAQCGNARYSSCMKGLARHLQDLTHTRFE